MDEELERALADLGNHRRENLPLEGSRMRVNLEVLEQSKRVHQPGTQEYALAKKEKSKVSAAQKWKAAFTASGVADTPAEIAAGINTGNSHRTRMVAAMRDAQEQRAGGNHRVGHQVPGRTKFAFNDARMTHGGIPPRMLAGPSAAQKRPVQSNAPTAAVATQGKSSISNRGGPAPHGRQPQRQYHQPPALHLSSSLSFEDDGTVTGIIFKGVCGGKGSPMEPAGPPEARANDTRTERKRSMSKADAPDPLINRPRRPSFDVSRLAKPEEFLATVSRLHTPTAPEAPSTVAKSSAAPAPARQPAAALPTHGHAPTSGVPTSRALARSAPAATVPPARVPPRTTPAPEVSEEALPARLTSMGAPAPEATATKAPAAQAPASAAVTPPRAQVPAPVSFGIPQPHASTVVRLPTLVTTPAGLVAGPCTSEFRGSGDLLSFDDLKVVTRVPSERQLLGVDDVNTLVVEPDGLMGSMADLVGLDIGWKPVAPTPASGREPAAEESLLDSPSVLATIPALAKLPRPLAAPSKTPAPLDLATVTEQGPSGADVSRRVSTSTTNDSKAAVYPSGGSRDTLSMGAPRLASKWASEEVTIPPRLESMWAPDENEVRGRLRPQLKPDGDIKGEMRRRFGGLVLLPEQKDEV